MKELPFRRRPQPYYETSIHAIKNMRRKMEDKHVIIPDFNTLFNVQVNAICSVMIADFTVALEQFIGD